MPIFKTPLFYSVKKNRCQALWAPTTTVDNLTMGFHPKIAVVGAGSLSHGKRLIDDLLTVPVFREGELALVGNNLKRLDVIAAYARRVMQTRSPGVAVSRTDSLLPAIEGSDLVVAMFDVGGYTAFRRDCAITKTYGLDTCIGDTAGPLGAFRALRNGPVMLDLAAAMRKACPGALLINYVNPMAPMVTIASRAGVSCIGICGGVEATRSYVASVLGLPRGALRTSFAGLNHLCWLLGVEGPEGDLYPRFREVMKKPELRGEETVRFEILQQFDYFVTESSGHLSDFFPFFRRTSELRARYCSGTGYSGASDAYLKLAGFLQRRIGDADYLAGQEPAGERSPDYGAAIVEAWLGGRKCAVYGNVMNATTAGGRKNPALQAFPAATCVEIPVTVGERSLEVPQGPALPAALAGLCAPLAFQHTTLAEALLAHDPDTLFAAIAQDTLTASVMDLPSIRSMTAELLDANAEWLAPGFLRPARQTVDASLRSSDARRKVVGTSPEIELVRNYERRKRGQPKDSAPNLDR